MRQDLLKLRSDGGLDGFLVEANPDLPSGKYTVGSVTDLGDTANPNTSAILTGDGVAIVGTKAITFNRLNPKNTFGKFGTVLKRPVVDVFGRAGMVAGTSMSISALAEAISRTLGVCITAQGTYADVDGTTAVTIPALGSAVDVDLVCKATSLRFRPSATDKLGVRLRNSGARWTAAVGADDVRSLVRNEIDVTDQRLIANIPFDTTINPTFAGDAVTLGFNATAAYAVAGDVKLTSALARLAASEYTVSDEYLLMPLKSDWSDTVSGTSAAITSGTSVAGWDSAGARDDMAMVPNATTGVLATAPNQANVRALFAAKKDFCIEMEVKLPSNPGTGYQMLFGTYQLGGTWLATDTFGIFLYGDVKRLYFAARVGTGGSSPIYFDGLCDDKWHTVTFTRNGSRWIGMVDGVIISDIVSDITLNTPTSTLTIGQSAAKTTIYKGQMRNLRVWNFAKYTAAYQPLKFYQNSIAKANIVSMVGKEYDSSKWVSLSSLVASTSEPTGTSIRWLICKDGKYYRYVAGSGLVETALADIPTLGMTTSDLKVMASAVASNPFGTKFALIARLFTTDGSATPSITSVSASARIPYTAYAGSVTSYPTPNISRPGLRDDIGTLFNANGINLGTHGLNAAGVKLGDVFGGQNDWTIEFDISKNNNGTEQAILWQRAGTTSTVMSVYIGFGADNTVVYGIYPVPGTSWLGRSSVAKITDSAKHHIEFNRSGGLLRLFIDGVLDSTLATTADNANSPTSPYYLGRQPTAETSYQRPPAYYLRDFRIFNYARNTASYVVQPYKVPVAGAILTLDGGDYPCASSRRTLSTVLYNVDFRSVIEDIGLSKIISESTANALSGSVVTAINAKLASLGIPFSFPPTVPLAGQLVSEILSKPPVAAGKNPNMSNVIVASTLGSTHSDTLFVADTITLHLR